jgi:hypothetical protein
VTFGQEDFECVKAFAEASKMNLSQTVLKLALEKLEDYEDTTLGKLALKRKNDGTQKIAYSRESFEKAWHDAQNN